MYSRFEAVFTFTYIIHVYIIYYIFWIQSKYTYYSVIPRLICQMFLLGKFFRKKPRSCYENAPLLNSQRFSSDVISYQAATVDGRNPKQPHVQVENSAMTSCRFMILASDVKSFPACPPRSECML